MSLCHLTFYIFLNLLNIPDQSKMSSSAFVSPRKRAVEYMLQFCKEHGLDRTYETLVEEFES